MPHELDLSNLTILYTGVDGQVADLNATGAPCQDLADLANFARDLLDEGAFGPDTLRELLEEIEREVAREDQEEREAQRMDIRAWE